MYIKQLFKFLQIVQKATPKTEEPVILPEMYHVVIRLINAFEVIDKQEEYTNRDEADLPSVLVFLPGIYEIEELYNCLTDPALRYIYINKN